jgi:hypothetical protein
MSDLTAAEVIDALRAEVKALVSALEKAPPNGPDSTPEYHHWYTAHRANALRDVRRRRMGKS